LEVGLDIKVMIFIVATPLLISIRTQSV
jgi:hypothetical protein